MGAYINPPNERKEAFLAREGFETAEGTPWSHFPIGMLPVVLVDNGPFTAAFICWKESEYERAFQSRDPRPKRTFAVEMRKLWEVSNLDIYLNHDGTARYPEDEEEAV
jgi:hypothetical protein